LVLWVPVYLESLANRSLGKYRNLKIMNFDEYKKADSSIPVKSFIKNPFTNLSCEMVEHAFNVICGISPDVKHKNYLNIDMKHITIDRFNLPKKYVVVCTGYTAPVRELLPQYVNEISNYINSKGYNVVFLGKKETPTATYHNSIKGNFSTEIEYDKHVNLIDKTTILESTLVIKNSSGIIGLDNGLLHLAGTTEVPIVGGFTTVKPEHRMPYRHDLLGWNYYPVYLSEEELPCVFCQSNWGFTFRHDFKYCYYKDYDCVKMLNVEKYITQLDKIL